MNTQKDYSIGNAEIGGISTVEKTLRAVIGFLAMLAVVVGIASTPLQYFVLSALGIYLVNTAIIGLDPFYAAVQYIHIAWRTNVSRTNISVLSLQ